jgi:hypothetical protein
MRKQLWVKVRATSVSQTLNNAELVLNSGADGIFLAANEAETTNFAQILELVIRRVGEKKFVGVVLKNVDSAVSAGFLPGIVPSAIWLEDVGYVSLLGHEVSRSVAGVKRTKRILEHHQFTGGVVGQVEPESGAEHGLAVTTTLLNPYLQMLVVNVRGLNDVAALAQAHLRAGEMKIAVAGTFNPETVLPYLEFADAVVVSESINRANGDPDGFRVRMMSDRMGR